MIRTTFALALLTCAASAHAADDKVRLRAAIERMGQADINKDGTVTREEVKATRAGFFGRFDRDSNGVLTADDIPTWMKMVNSDANFDTFAKNFDANKDGKITREEWINGPMKDFDRVDANRDGKATATERQAVLAALK